MSAPRVQIRPILNRLVRRGEICPFAVESIIRDFGEEPQAHSANLRKAVAYRGLDYYRQFCREWLGWPHSLRDYLGHLSEVIIWDMSIRNPHRNKDLSDRVIIAEKAHVAATLAWIKEIQKP